MRYLISFDGNLTLSSREKPDSLAITRMISFVVSFFSPELDDDYKRVAMEFLLYTCFLGSKSDWQRTGVYGRRDSESKHWISHKRLRLKCDNPRSLDLVEKQQPRSKVTGLIGIFHFDLTGQFVDGEGGALIHHRLTLDVVNLETWAMGTTAEYPVYLYENVVDSVSSYIR